MYGQWPPLDNDDDDDGDGDYDEEDDVDDECVDLKTNKNLSVRLCFLSMVSLFKTTEAKRRINTNIGSNNC